MLDVFFVLFTIVFSCVGFLWALHRFVFNPLERWGDKRWGNPDPPPNQQVLEHLQVIRPLIQKDPEAAEDAVLDLMDRLTGWCSPGMGIDLEGK